MSEIGTGVSERRRYDRPTVCNPIELFDGWPRAAGYMDPRIRACYPDLLSMVRFAATATFRASERPRDSEPRESEMYLGTEERRTRGSGTSRRHRWPSRSSTILWWPARFGEVTSTICPTLGAVGVITSGTGRDLDQIQYHYQWHIPIKRKGFDSGVNLTVGLPFFRASVDHDTVIDISGTGKADHASLRTALDLARAFAGGEG